MLEEKDVEAIRSELGVVVADLNDYEFHTAKLRIDRDNLFLSAWDMRALTVTEMARIAGLRRESVHQAINRMRRS
jgi:hypothetical protein